MPSVLSPRRLPSTMLIVLTAPAAVAASLFCAAQRERGLLVRHRDVQPFPAGGAEAAHGRFERRGLGVDELVGQTLPGLAREHGMDQRRPAVLDGVTDERVAVGRRLLVIGHSRGFLCFSILRGFLYLANRSRRCSRWRRRKASCGAPGAKASTRRTCAITTRNGACPCATIACTSSSSCSKQRRPGLSWWTILRKRDGYRRAFADFDAAKVARFTPRTVEKLMQDASIVRNRQKIEAAIANARGFLAIQKEFGTFDRYVWEFVGGKPIVNRWRKQSDVPPTSKESDALSKDLKSARLQVRRLDDHLCAHAGDGARQRPPRRLFSLPREQRGRAR